MGEWKPGDVAIAAYPVWGGSDCETTYEEMRISRYGHGWARLDNPDDFCNDDSRYRPADPRPLVVIDPEDRGQVERLRECFTEAGFPTATVQGNLRDFLDPKPDEPTGLGAVVEDAAGLRYVRTVWVEPWDRDGIAFEYTHINAVRILSEGVSNV